jgi:hypothetical protein
MKKPFDDGLIIAGLAVTIPHTAHILCQFEAPDGWGYFVAWSFAVFVDFGIARCAWVASNRQAPEYARWTFGGGLGFLLAVSYSLNIAYYLSQKADGWAAGWLALVAPALLAILAGGKSFLDNLPMAETFPSIATRRVVKVKAGPAKANWFQRVVFGKKQPKVEPEPVMATGSTKVRIKSGPSYSPPVPVATAAADSGLPEDIREELLPELVVERSDQREGPYYAGRVRNYLGRSSLFWS